jgi:hypothetical protein
MGDAALHLDLFEQPEEFVVLTGLLIPGTRQVGVSQVDSEVPWIA